MRGAGRSTGGARHEGHTQRGAGSQSTILSRRGSHVQCYATTMSDYFDKKAVERHAIKHFSVKTLHSSSKSSFCWKYFGTLLLEKDGKKRSVLIDNIFCSKCIDTCKSNKDDDLMGW